MGFADFLATAGRGTVVGNIAEAAGGVSARHQGLTNFIDNELPKYAQAMQDNIDEKKIPQLGMQFVSAAAKAGMQPAAVKELLEMLVKPAMEGVRSRQAGDFYGGLANELSPQTEPLTPRVPDPTQGMQLAPATTFEPRTTPGRQMNLADTVRMAETEARTGVKIPAHLAEMARSPSIIGQNEAQARNQDVQAGKHKTEQNLLIEKQEALRGIPKTPVGNTGMDLNMLGLATGGTALGPVATAQMPGPLFAEQRAKLIADEIQSRASAGASGAAASYHRAQEENLRTGGPTVTEAVTDPNKDVLARTIDERAFAAAAVNRGINKLPPEQQGPALQKLAGEMNYDLQGTPTLNVPGPQETLWGYGPNKKDPKTGKELREPPTLTGTDFSFTPRPQTKTTTRTKGGAAPAGQPAPAQGGKQLDEAGAIAYLQRAGGDKAKARAMAAQDGFKF